MSQKNQMKLLHTADWHLGHRLHVNLTFLCIILRFHNKTSKIINL